MTLAKYALIYNFWEDKVSWPMLMFGAFCLFTMAVSTFAHIFHTKSLNIHYTSLFIDYIGASLYGFGSGLLALYVFSDDKTYDAVESIVFPLLWIYAWFDFVVMCGGLCVSAIFVCWLIQHETIDGCVRQYRIFLEI
jgi:predicted membrane channel-forming protein YqfA (hemolysin III family)